MLSRATVKHRGTGPSLSISQQDLECDLLPACMFFNPWINEYAAGFITRACLCQVVYNSTDRLRPAAPGICRHTWKVHRFHIFKLHILSPYCYATWQVIVESWNAQAYIFYSSQSVNEKYMTVRSEISLRLSGGKEAVESIWLPDDGNDKFCIDVRVWITSLLDIMHYYHHSL